MQEIRILTRSNTIARTLAVPECCFSGYWWKLGNSPVRGKMQGPVWHPGLYVSCEQLCRGHPRSCTQNLLHLYTMTAISGCRLPQLVRKALGVQQVSCTSLQGMQQVHRLCVHLPTGVLETNNPFDQTKQMQGSVSAGIYWKLTKRVAAAAYNAVSRCAPHPLAR